MPKSHSLFLFFSLALLLVSSGSPVKLDHEGMQRKDGCVVIDTREANFKDKIACGFTLHKGGKYVVQIVHSPEDLQNTELTSSGRIFEAGKKYIELGDELSRDYWIKDGIVSTFKKPITLEHSHFNGEYVEQHVILINSSIKPSYIRLIPAIYLESRIKVGSQEYYEEWIKMHESPEKQAAMQWYQKAKFGMFIHWGLYSQAAGSWKGVKIEDSPHKGPRVAEWLMFTFQISRDEYKELAKTFKPNQSFAETIARLARDTGMKYMVITAKHHDGFALFDSACSDWDIADASPYEGDLIKELYEACEAEGIGFGVYYSHGHDWMDGCDANYANVKKKQDALNVPTRPQGKNRWDPSPDKYENYLENKSYAQVKELVEMMPNLKLIWFDGEGDVTEAQALRFYKMIYEMNPNIIVNRRVGYEYGDYMDAGDNKTPKAGELAPKYFETCGTANHSWGYKAHDHDWKTTPELLRNFVDIISKGGNYLLNIGPTGAGSVPKPCVEGFLGMGEWIKKNGEAVYGTGRWNTFTEKNDSGEYWFSEKAETLYVMSITPPAETITLEALNSADKKVSAIRVIGEETELQWEQTDTELTIQSKDLPASLYGYALAIEFN